MSEGIRIEKLRKAWPDGSVGLDDVDLTIPGGQFVAILGRSGAGKSTLLRTAARLIEPTSGRVFVGGYDVTAATGRELYRARARVGFVFQQFNLVKSYTAIDNVLAARVSHAPWLRGLIGLWSDADREVARRCLTEVGLGDKIDALARELSGGQQQRVAVARAFAQEPSAIFADEPTASLDPQLAATVLELLRDYGKRREVPVLVNVHTIEHARRYADRILGMRRGRIVHDGPARELTDAVVDGIYNDPARTEAA
ncbi:MAG: phosphonate ABC transporter ATP-binding protein [Polyangiales bacterium]